MIERERHLIRFWVSVMIPILEIVIMLSLLLASGTTRNQAGSKPMGALDKDVTHNLSKVDDVESCVRYFMRLQDTVRLKKVVGF